MDRDRLSALDRPPAEYCLFLTMANLRCALQNVSLQILRFRCALVCGVLCALGVHWCVVCVVCALGVHWCVLCALGVWCVVCVRCALVCVVCVRCVVCCVR